MYVSIMIHIIILINDQRRSVRIHTLCIIYKFQQRRCYPNHDYARSTYSYVCTIHRHTGIIIQHYVANVRKIYIFLIFFFRFLPHFLLFPNVSYVTTEYVTREKFKKTILFCLYTGGPPLLTYVRIMCIYIQVLLITLLHAVGLLFCSLFPSSSLIIYHQWILPAYFMASNDIKSGSRADIIELLPHPQVSVA